MYEERAGKPSMATKNDNIELRYDMVLLDRRLTTDEVVHRLHIV